MATYLTKCPKCSSYNIETPLVHEMLSKHQLHHLLTSMLSVKIVHMFLLILKQPIVVGGEVLNIKKK